MSPRTPLALIFSVCCPLAAQTGSTALHHVEGRPVIRVQLRAGERSYPCHLLVDLNLRTPLFLHNNAARSLRARQVDVESGELELQDLPVTAGRDRFLERLTAEQAEALDEVPVAGAIGPAAFGNQTLVLDGPGKRLQVLPPNLDAEAPRSARGRLVLDLRGEPGRDGYTVQAAYGPRRQRQAAFHLVTRHPFTFAEPDLLTQAGDALYLGRLNLVEAAALRPVAMPQARAGLGARLLAQFKLTLQPGPQRLLLEYDKPPERSPIEAAFYAARYHSGQAREALAEFLQEQPDNPFSLEAAQELFGLELSAGDTDLLRRSLAAKAWIAAARDNARGTTALKILEALPDDDQHSKLREELAELSLKAARKDLDGNASHKLRLELGRLARRQDDLKSARRHLLSAAFGMPTDGPTSLELGRVYEAMGQLERAQGRYFLAMLDAEQTPAEGYLALKSVYKKIHGDDAGLIESLVPMAEGRVPALHPIPREAPAPAPGARKVLVELFTGAHCPPCVAADVAFDALGSYFQHQEVCLIQWHLPIPAAEPLVNGDALNRAREVGVSSTPQALFGGEAMIRGGGRKGQAAAVFAKYRKQAEALLEAPAAPQLQVQARLQGERLQVDAAAVGAGDLRLHLVLCEDLVVFPGGNGMLFHHHVARARLSPAAGLDASKPQQAALQLGKLRSQLEDDLLRMEEAGAEFRIRPTRPDASRLLVVAFLTRGEAQKVLNCRSIEVSTQ